MIEKIIILASGPSLNDGQIEQIKESGVSTIAVNNTWQKAPFARWIYANDYEWWKEHYHSLPKEPEKWSGSKIAADEFCLNYHAMREAYNSGMKSIDLALKMGGQVIILVGFDCAFHGGKKHWHGDHPEPLSNPDSNSLEFWKYHFKRLRKAHPGAVIINSSAYTELEVFPRLSLSEAIESEHSKLRHICDNYSFREKMENMV